MKRIIIACGSGVATSTVANQKVSAYLDDFAIATTVVGANMPCPVLPGLPLLTGVGADKLFSDVEEQMNK